MRRPKTCTSPFLYKYRSPDTLKWLESLVLDHKLYFPTAKQLEDDPREARPTVASVSKTAMIEMLKWRSAMGNPTWTAVQRQHEFNVIEYNVRRLYTEEQLRSTLEKLLHDELCLWRIYSLATTPDNTHLWREYGARHAGYCIEFNNQFDGKIFEIRYTDKIDIDVTSRKPLKPWFLFHKTLRWRKEAEVRLLGARDSSPFADIAPTVLNRIILGKRISKSDERFIRDIVGRRTPLIEVISESGL
jgi:hypothetical protein